MKLETIVLAVTIAAAVGTGAWHVSGLTAQVKALDKRLNDLPRPIEDARDAALATISAAGESYGLLDGAHSQVYELPDSGKTKTMIPTSDGICYFVYAHGPKDVQIVNEDGYWRLRHFRSTDSNPAIRAVCWRFAKDES